MVVGIDMPQHRIVKLGLGPQPGPVFIAGQIEIYLAEFHHEAGVFDPGESLGQGRAVERSTHVLTLTHLAPFSVTRSTLMARVEHAVYCDGLTGMDEPVPHGDEIGLVDGWMDKLVHVKIKDSPAGI